MNVNFVENLVFQKKEYPDIYRSYNVYEKKWVAKQFICKKDVGIFYVLVDEDLDIIKLIYDLFHADTKYEKRIDTCIINFGIEESVAELDLGVVKMEINHPYFEHYPSMLISKTIDERYLREAYVFISYKCKVLKQLQELKIRNYCEYTYEDNNLESNDILLEKFIKSKPEYILNLYVKPKEKYINFNGINTKANVSLLIIKILNDNWEKDEKALFQLCIDKMVSVFVLRSKEILANYLKVNLFDKNFVYVATYQLFIDKLRKRINKYFESNIVESVKKMKLKIREYAVLHNELSRDIGILGLDNYIEEEFIRLINLLEDI